MLTLDSPWQSKDFAVSTDAPTICEVVHGLPVGGAEVLVSRIIRRMRNGYRFVVACLDQVGELGETLMYEGIEVTLLKRRPGFDWSCVRRLRDLCVDNNVDLVHAHQYTPFAYAIATRVYGRRPAVLFTEHGRFHPDYPSLKRKVFNRLFSAKRDMFVAVGKSVRQALVKNEGLPGDRIEVVYNGVDFEAFREDVDIRCETRREIGFDDEFVVAMVARLDTIKDHDTAIRAIAAAITQNPNIRLMLIGDGPLRESIARQVTELRLPHQIRLLGSRSDVARLLRAADAFLLTSVSEGIPVTIIEAMGAGVPVVATAVGGIPEMIEHRVTGLLADAKDILGIAAAIVELAGDERLRKSLAESARARAHSQFSEESMITRYDELFRSMVRAAR